ncbi:MAG: hypothetical protein R6U68_08230, partial [Desulfobacteraceae bacterium]
MRLNSKFLTRKSASLVILPILCLILLFLAFFLIVNTTYVKKRMLDHFFPEQNIAINLIQVNIFPRPCLEIKTLGLSLEKNSEIK